MFSTGRRVHDRVPWFWSDQFDNKLLIVGLSQGFDQQVLRGDPATRSFSVCYLKDGELLALEAINHPTDYMAARRLIAERARPDLDKLADPKIALKEAHLMPKIVSPPDASARDRCVRGAPSWMSPCLNCNANDSLAAQRPRIDACSG